MKVAVPSLIATQNRKWSYWDYSCIEFLVLKLMLVGCGVHHRPQPSTDGGVLGTQASDGGVLGRASAQLFSDT